MSEVSNEWIRCTLGELTETSSGGTPNRSDPLAYGGDIPWVKSGEVALFDIWDTDERITSHGMEISAAKLVAEGSLLMAMYGATAGQVARLKIPAATNQAVLAIRPHENSCDPDFLYHYLVRSKDDLLLSCQGSGQPNLNAGIVKSLKIDLPPLPEQKKIAEILSAIDSEISALEAEVDKIKNHTFAISRRIFLGLMSNEGIQKYPAEDLCSLVTKGTTPSKSATAESKSVPFLRVTNLGFNGTIDPTQDFELITQASHKVELKRSICRSGDILMNIVGPPLGKVGIIPQEIGECNINQAVLVYRIDTDRLDPSFFVHFLLGQVAQSWFNSQSKKTSGQQNLTIEICKSLAVPLPSMSEQKKLSGCLDSLSALASRLVKKKSSLEFLKSAVSSDLLSGRKRVSV